MPLFAMVHARSKEECERSAAEIADQISCSEYSILYSTREFKKERVKYLQKDQMNRLVYLHMDAFVMKILKSQQKSV